MARTTPRANGASEFAETKSGIVSNISSGTHFCVFYQTKDDLISILTPYFKAGLENNELCMWITSDPLETSDAEMSLRKVVRNLDDYVQQGQIEILGFHQWYITFGRFEPDKVLQGWMEKEKQAMEKGFTGLRLAGNTSWLCKEDWKEFSQYEAKINEIIGDHRMTALCSYPLDRCEAPEVIDIVSNHQYAVIRREGVWESIEGFEHKQFNEDLQPAHGVTEGADELMKAQRLESVDTIAARIAHDFNNNLTAILGNVSLARMYNDPVKSSEKLMAAERKIMQTKELTRQLLTFSKESEFIKQIVHIGEMLEDSANFASRGSNVKCEFSIPDDLWSVEINEGQIRQVISNMIINADQAMPEGGVIKLRVENLTLEGVLSLSDGEYIKISIEDQGIGISKENLHNIFRLYFTTKQEGSGLGLTTSYIIIQKHGGLIRAESQVGAGATFHIYLPAYSGEASAKKPGTEKSLVTGTGRILVMDDEKYIRDLASEMLNTIGYKVTTAIDGAEAIGMYQEARHSGLSYDAVVIDLTVPGGMGGKETIQKLKAMDPEAKAIISSGYSSVPIMTDFEKYGFKGAIAKPYEVTELSIVLHEVIAGKKSA